VNGLDQFLTMPAGLDVWLLVGYALVVVAGSKLTEVLARVHFERGRRYAERGFRYDSDLDHYDCPQGERLTLHLVNPSRQMAVYRAPAARCAACPLKADCTPHDEGRHLFRSLAAWAETEVGRFHQRLSLVMVATGAVLPLLAFVHGAGKPGCGLLLVVSLAVVPFLVRDARRVFSSPRPSGERGRG
jgi:hypothetical protein